MANFSRSANAGPMPGFRLCGTKVNGKCGEKRPFAANFRQLLRLFPQLSRFIPAPEAEVEALRPLDEVEEGHATNDEG